MKALSKFTLIFLTFAIATNQGFAREQIRVVGSSTAFPFTTTIAEEFGTQNEFRTPIVESLGTGGGMRLFCGGIGERFPDFANASRKMTESEISQCRSNGVKQIIEIKIGYDGIVFANSNKAPALNLTKKQIFLALAERIPHKGKLINNPYSKWNEIDKSLPNQQIEIYGPPPTSGTRDSIVEIIMQPSCMDIAEFIKEFPDEALRKRACRNIRNDGKFIEAGENDNVIVKKLILNRKAIGVFGFNFLQQNKERLQGTTIDGVEPNFDNIYDGKYILSRPLFVYFKKENINAAPNIKKFIKEMISQKAIGKNGYLTEKGLVPMHEEEFQKSTKDVLSKI